MNDKWNDAEADAARLALELECLLLDTKDMAVVSKWWGSAHEALELHRRRLQIEFGENDIAFAWENHRRKV